MFVHLRAPSSGASVALLGACALAALLYLRPWERVAPASAADTVERENPPTDDILRIGLESPFVHDAGDGIVHLGIRITPPTEANAERAPVALALVIDSSGSMDGLAMDHARHAARSVVERLRDGDRVAVIDFDDVARAAVPTTVLGTDRSAVLAAIDGMQAGGGTALHAGVDAGIAGLGTLPGTRRVLLVSDGQATVGPSTPEAVVSGLDPRGITLSTIGVGTGYDEKMMLAVADHGRGRFHHLSDPIELAGILDAELASARAVVARGATIDLKPAPGVALLTVAGETPQPLADGVWRVPVGDLYAGETRSLTVRLRVPTRSLRMPLVDVHHPVGDVQLAYRPVDEAAPVQREARAHYVLTPSADAVRAGMQPRWMVAADRMRVSHVLVDAAALLRGGDLLEAQAILRDERARLQSRKARTEGLARDELDALIALLADPYVDAVLDAPPAAPAQDLDARFQAALDAVRHGRAVGAAGLAGLDAERLRILRNGAYARHGYRFKSSELQAFFEGTGWYAADAGFAPSRLTPADVANVALIKQHEGGAAIAAAAPAVPATTAVDFADALARVRRGEAVGALAGLDLVALRRLRNAAYARHGYAFRAGDLRRFFEATAWYRVDPAYDPARLTLTDGENVRAIKAREQALVARAGRDAVREFELRSRAKARQALR